MRIVLTLCFIYYDDKIILGLKKRGFGKGRYNGFGGKVLKGESLRGAVIREMYEESGIRAEKISKRGILEFSFKGNPEVLEVHVYKILKWKGMSKETEEMKPRWFSLADIPFSKMWPDDRYWLPLFISGKHFRGSFLFGKEDSILRKTLTEIRRI